MLKYNLFWNNEELVLTILGVFKISINKFTYFLDHSLFSLLEYGHSMCIFSCTPNFKIYGLFSVFQYIHLSLATYQFLRKKKKNCFNAL